MVVFFVACLGSYSCNGGMITPPPDLANGSKYYLIFVTGAGNVLTGQSSDIADYDSFVNSQAPQADGLAGITWKALGSTATVSARDHLGIGDYPIYRLDRVRVANNAADLWDGTIAAIVASYLPNSFVWTGSNSDGTASVNYLGSSTPVVGFTARIDSGWLVHTLLASNTTHRMIGISQLLTVGSENPAVPEPATVTVWVAAAGCFLSIRKRLKRAK